MAAEPRWIWCEHCRDHFDEEHYTPVTGWVGDELMGGDHKVGAEWGRTGELLAIERDASSTQFRDGVIWGFVVGLPLGAMSAAIIARLANG